jgi:hypothetical protein
MKTLEAATFTNKSVSMQKVLVALDLSAHSGKQHPMRQKWPKLLMLPSLLFTSISL